MCRDLSLRDVVIELQTPAPAVGEPANIAVHKDATTTTTTNARICHPDFLIVCSAENELTNGKNILVDVTVAGPNAQSSHRAQHDSGALAESAERRKILEVSRFWKHNDSVRVVPFAVEYTGGLGEIANASPARLQSGHHGQRLARQQFHLRRIRQFPTGNGTRSEYTC